MTPADDPKVLLTIAREDLAAAAALQAAEGISDAPVGFHAQQAVEKALKATLASKQIAYPFSHDIALMIEICEERGLDLPDEIREAEILNPYAAALRYGLGESEDVDVADALRWAAAAVEWAESQIEPSR
jgi:HEPN domain-containing protein